MLDGISCLDNQVSWEENTEVELKNGLFDSSEDGFDEREEDGFAGDLDTGILEGNKDSVADSLEEDFRVGFFDVLSIKAEDELIEEYKDGWFKDLEEDFNDGFQERRIILVGAFDDEAVYYLDWCNFRWHTEWLS